MSQLHHRSIVSYVGISENGHCGYCKSARRAKAKFEEQSSGSENHTEGGRGESSSSKCPSAAAKNGNQPQLMEEDGEDGSVVFGLIAHCLCSELFNQLLDMGWSRSGRYLYKPLMERTCCPQYTIRLDVHKFRLSRTQKRVLRTMRNFLRNNERPKDADVVREEEKRNQSVAKQPGRIEKEEGKIADLKRIKCVEDRELDQRQPKKKVIRRQRAEQRLKARGVDLEQYKRDRAAKEEARRRTVRSFLDGYNGEDWAHKLELRLVAQPSAELEQDIGEEYQLFRRYQMQIHGEDEEDLSPNSFRRFLAASPLIVEESDDLMESGDEGSPSIKFGSYHQQYRLDGRIIAVAVIDVLPRCLSAKYFFYDPDFAFLSLGTYSALREIEFTQQLAARRPELHYYYMGFYLFDCPKMRYKGRFRPSELLCDHCFNWVPLSECDRIIDAAGGRFSTFHPDNEPAKNSQQEFGGEDADLDRIRCISEQRELLTFGQLRRNMAQQRQQQQQQDGAEGNGGGGSQHAQLVAITEKFRNFARFAGPAAFHMVLVL